MKTQDFLVQNDEEQDQALHMKAAPVNIRLYRSNPLYRKLIRKIVNYMLDLMDSTYENYPTLKGISGANIGVPLNIIIVKFSDDYKKVMINPVITAKSEYTKVLSSNCGSLSLTKKIKVGRHTWVDVEYYDLKGKKQSKRYYISAGRTVGTIRHEIDYDLSDGRMGGTIQHEIDHNMGILITDKEVEDDSSTGDRSDS